MQELFQCKLTRKGTIAPSDRQSRLRKSMTNTFDTPSSETSNISIVNINVSNLTNELTTNNNNNNNSSVLSENSNSKVKFAHTGGTHVSLTSITNGYGTMYPPNKNGQF